MLPSRPEVNVYAPSILFSGQRATAEIVIEAEKETRIEYIDTRLTGHQGWRVGGGEHSYATAVKYPELEKRVAGEGVLPAGTSRFRVTFALPAGMPPTHRVLPAWAYLELYVRVAIPWWPDGKYHFTLPVRVPPSDVAREPYAIRSNAGPGQPRIELSLASRRLVVGEAVVGSVALFHVDDRKARELALTLVPSLALYGEGRVRERRGATLGVTIELPAGSAGTSVPFRFQLPADMTPSFKTTSHELHWWLSARTGSLFGTGVEVSTPLDILDASAAEQMTKLTVAPRLSDARIEDAFERFGERHGWQRVTRDDGDEEIVVEREAYDDTATLQIAYIYRGQQGSFLVTRLLRPLGLGLAVTPSTPLRELLAKDIEVESEAWDRAHRAIARSAEQAGAFLRPAVPAVQAATRVLGTMCRWTDDEIVFERAVLAVEPHDLAESARALAELAAMLARIPIAPPPELAVDLDGWHRLAQRLDGRLVTGDLSIEGTLDLLPVDVLLEFDGQRRPARVRVYVGEPGSESAEPDQLGAWPDDVIDVQVADGIASGALVLDGVADASRVRELVFGLRALIERLRNPAGPYR